MELSSSFRTVNSDVPLLRLCGNDWAKRFAEAKIAAEKRSILFMVVVIGALVWPFGVVKLQQQWSNCKIYVAMMMTNFKIRSFLRSTKEL
jgi:hypothetical protein